MSLASAYCIIGGCAPFIMYITSAGCVATLLYLRCMYHACMYIIILQVSIEEFIFFFMEFFFFFKIYYYYFALPPYLKDSR
jgi:hypothetical protein